MKASFVHNPNPPCHHLSDYFLSPYTQDTRQSHRHSSLLLISQSLQLHGIHHQESSTCCFVGGQELKWPYFGSEDMGQSKEVRNLPFLIKRQHSMTIPHHKISCHVTGVDHSALEKPVFRHFSPNL